MVRTGFLVVAVALGFGCTKHNPEACCTTQLDCDAKGLPLGTGCETGEACINNTCVAPQRCQANSDCDSDLPICDVVTGTCALCVTAADCSEGICDAGVCRLCTADSDCESGYCDLDTGSCGLNVTDWKYLPNACDTQGTGTWVLGSGGFFDTSEDANCSEIITQNGGPQICVLHFASVDIANTVLLKVSGSRALAVVTDGDFTWDGTLDIGVQASTPWISGPGGGYSVSGTHPNPPSSAQPDDTEDAGGGGAGFATPGGSGGGNVANGGPAVDVASLGVLTGGPRAQSLSPASMPMLAFGGGGGGALVVISCSGKIDFSGRLRAAGGGGEGGSTVDRSASSQPPLKAGGFGGGAGGHVLFQAHDILLTGSFYALGGGGGEGRTESGMRGNRGATSDLVGTCAAGGAGASAPAGDGGQGGCDSMPPASGQPTTQRFMATSGGGGGSMGFFRTATFGAAPVVNPADAQPMFSPNEMIGRR